MKRVAWPSFDRDDIKVVTSVLRSGKVNYHTGDYGRRFEKAFAERVGSRYAVSLTSGTAALDAALLALGVGRGDEVIVTPYSFIASSMCVLAVGARPVFCDVGPDHLMDPAKLEALVTARTKAIVVVHLYGVVADMAKILRVARRHGLAVIEDCAQAFGGEYRGRTVGSLGKLGCFSFCQTKHITTGGEGGMVVTDNRVLASRLRALRDHGRIAEKGDAVHYSLGFNLRMTEIQSALGLSALRRCERTGLPRRRCNLAYLTAALRAHPLVRSVPLDTPARRNAAWLAPFALRQEKLKCTIGEFIAELQKRTSLAYEIRWPIAYREPAFRKAKCRGRCPAAEALRSATVGFWLHPTITRAELAEAVRAFRELAAEKMV